MPFYGGRGPPDIKGMSSLKVDNLTYRTTPEDLRRCFEKYGDIGDIYIPRDRFSRESRGFAFVRYYILGTHYSVLGRTYYIVANQSFFGISSFLISSKTQDLNQFLKYDNAGIHDTLLDTGLLIGLKNELEGESKKFSALSLAYVGLGLGYASV
ncbi:hypothetical protein HAZT_HAZT008428 [Hyalella azteca]|uniref:Serine/arginine-rich splicing factor 2 n=1 Tax=Hyalella azteca TaxID=294128 RepID=A0A6A0GV37_HYAAZ|nr:hypothetical protein HAZT_HAZT008428 [Hyalella azteca]